MIAALIFMILACPLAIAGLFDMRGMTIPNKISAFIFLAWIATLPLTWQGTDILIEHLATGIGLFAFGFALWMIGGWGGGDAKILGATGFWFTYADIIPYVLYTTLFGAALGITLLMGRAYMPIRLQTSSLTFGMFSAGRHMPYGLALAASAIYWFPYSTLGQHLIG